MSVPVIHSEVVAFVAAVRAQLDDLGAEEAEELTGGLEADLDDALADGGSLGARLDDPAGYAAELRAAAGLPPRSAATGSSGAVGRAVDRLRAQIAARRSGLESAPWWPGVRDFGVCLRPAWWVARALLAACLVQGRSAGTFRRPAGWGGLTLSLVAIVISVQLGRRGVARRRRIWRWGIGAGNLLAAACLMVAVGGAWSTTYVTMNPEPQPPADGIYVGGVQVDNVFAYDAQGLPLAYVQLFDQEGHPITLGGLADAYPASDGDGYAYSPDGTVVLGPAVDARGRLLWNVFPLRQQVIAEGSEPTSTPRPTVPPMSGFFLYYILERKWLE